MLVIITPMQKYVKSVCRRLLFNAAKFGWRPLLECRAVTLLRRETRWNLLGCPKLVNRSQPLVGRRTPHCENIWRTYWCLPSFFPIVDSRSTCLSCEDSVRQNCAMVLTWRIFGDFLRHVFSASCVQHILDLYPKFALRPHHVLKYGRHPICDGWKQARKKIERTRMWANAQGDGRPAEYRWRPLFNAAKFGWRPLLECRAITLSRRETRWN